MIPQSIVKAEEAYKQAANAFIEAAKEAYPVGCVVGVTFGRARIRGEVTGHSDSWWYKPGEVHIKNVVTGKNRHFNAASRSCQVEVLEQA